MSFMDFAHEYSDSISEEFHITQSINPAEAEFNYHVH